jgi:hypothetical protein
MENIPPAPHSIKGDELRAMLEGTAGMTTKETVDLLNACGLLTPVAAPPSEPLAD